MTSALARKFALDVATYIPGLLITDPSIAWIRFLGITDFSKKIDPTMQDVTDYDNDGWSDSEKTLQTFSITAKARRPYNGGVYDPGQEIAHAAEDQFGDSSKIFCRYYDRNGGSEAKAGRATVDWQQTKTGVADVEEITVTLNGSGKIVKITNPALSALLPAIANVGPAGKGSGQAVTIYGSGFTGGSLQVLFAASRDSNGVATGTAAADFSIISDSLVVATLPAGAAGTTQVAVKTAVGSSPLFTYTRAA